MCVTFDKNDNKQLHDRSSAKWLSAVFGLMVNANDASINASVRSMCIKCVGRDKTVTKNRQPQLDCHTEP